MSSEDKLVELLQLDNDLIKRLDRVSVLMNMNRQEFIFKSLELFILNNEYKYHLI